jgi:hypothetical protein
LPGDLFGRGGGGESEVIGEDVACVVIAAFFAFPNLSIGADGEAVDRVRRFCRPLAQTLGEQREGGNQEQDMTLGTHALGNDE